MSTQILSPNRNPSEVTSLKYPTCLPFSVGAINGTLTSILASGAAGATSMKPGAPIELPPTGTSLTPLQVAFPLLTKSHFFSKNSPGLNTVESGMQISRTKAPLGRDGAAVEEATVSTTAFWEASVGVFTTGTVAAGIGTVAEGIGTAVFPVGANRELFATTGEVVAGSTFTACRAGRDAVGSGTLLAIAGLATMGSGTLLATGASTGLAIGALVPATGVAKGMVTPTPPNMCSVSATCGGGGLCGTWRGPCWCRP